jgi:peptidyl-prolyl cis-trans isomerase B (cyclophilin B)
LLLLGISACQEKKSSALSENVSILTTYADRPQLQGKATVVLEIKTAKAGLGLVTLELNGEAAPLTAGQFADLVQGGFYDGLTFHRVVKDPQPFVVQGGDPKGDGTGGAIDPTSLRPRTIPLEILVKEETTPHYNRLLDVVATGTQLALHHERGALAMARSNALDSASSQFYIALSELPTLDGRYAVFGQVTEGMEVVDRIQVGDVIQSAKLIKGANNLIHPKP